MRYTGKAAFLNFALDASSHISGKGDRVSVESHFFNLAPLGSGGVISDNQGELTYTNALIDEALNHIVRSWVDATRNRVEFSGGPLVNDIHSVNDIFVMRRRQEGRGGEVCLLMSGQTWHTMMVGMHMPYMADTNLPEGVIGEIMGMKVLQAPDWLEGILAFELHAVVFALEEEKYHDPDTQSVSLQFFAGGSTTRLDSSGVLWLGPKVPSEVSEEE